MEYVFSKTSIGYLHKKKRIPCEDYSLSFKDKEKSIIAVADGHGGKVYIRSKLGSKFACLAIFNVFNKLDKYELRKLNEESYLTKLKLSVLCEWNKLVERDLSSRPIKAYEIEDLNEEEISALKLSPSKAYGTTLSGAISINDKIIVISIGDSESFYLNKGKGHMIFNEENNNKEDEEPVSYLTHSMCEEDAFKHMKIRVLDSINVDAIVLSTDGLLNPYQTLDNFFLNFLKPLMNKILINQDIIYIDKFIDKLASEMGYGDDVSLAFLIKSNSFKKYYK